jgi:hypothetical protein
MSIDEEFAEMYWRKPKGNDDPGQRIALERDMQDALDAVFGAHADEPQVQSTIDLIDAMRAAGENLGCDCQEDPNPPAELTPTKRGKTRFFTRRDGGMGHAEHCPHYPQDAHFVVRVLPTKGMGGEPGQPRPLELSDFLWSVSASGQVAPIPRPHVPGVVAIAKGTSRPLATLSALATLIHVASGHDHLARIPFEQSTGHYVFPEKKVLAALEETRSTEGDRRCITDVLLVDPPSFKNLIGQTLEHARKGLRGAGHPVGYAFILVDSISRDPTRCVTTLNYLRGPIEDRVTHALELPCLVAVTSEHTQADAGPFLVTLSMSSRDGSAEACDVRGYARQVVSTSTFTPLDATTERLTARDLVGWAGRQKADGWTIEILRPLRIKIGPGGHAFIADFEVVLTVRDHRFLAFVEVHGVGGSKYWASKATPHAEMMKLGRLIHDNRSIAARHAATSALHAALDAWLSDCLVTALGSATHTT